MDCRLNLNARIVRCGKKVNAPWQPAVIAFIVLAEVFCTSVGAGVELMCCEERPAALSVGGCSAVMQVDAFCTNLPFRYPPSQSSRPIHLEMH